jgi:multisubunit Na+/H+ antiporter MnhC subunit
MGGYKRTGIANLLGIAAAIVSIGAGVYLLQSESASAETTVFDILMHGIGIYFIARGMWMAVELLGYEPVNMIKPKPKAESSSAPAPKAPPATTPNS